MPTRPDSFKRRAESLDHKAILSKLIYNNIHEISQLNELENPFHVIPAFGSFFTRISPMNGSAGTTGLTRTVGACKDGSISSSLRGLSCQRPSPY
jgi:hypothetical protein